MGYALTRTFQYFTSEEGALGIATASVFILASAVMTKCLVAYPAVSMALAVAG